MGAWGTGVFENDTALDRIAEMSELMEKYFADMISSEDENDIILSAYLYLKAKGKAGSILIDNDVTLLREIEFATNGLRLSEIDKYKYTIIGNLYRCLDEVNTWNKELRENRKTMINELITRITKEG